MASERKLTCPCVKAEKPKCREGSKCWHFGKNNSGTCDHCHNTGYIIPDRTAYRDKGDV
jgi:hypothetical protein